jgi:hypothetical protein
MNSSANAFLYDSRLVRLLSDLNISGVEDSQNHFVERFGDLVDFFGSITLSAGLGKFSTVAFEPTKISAEDIKDEFLRVRTALVRFVAKSFVPSAVRSRGKLPSPAEFHSHCKLTGVYADTRSEVPGNHVAAYEPFRNFYVTRQGDLDIKIRQLRSHVKDSIAGLSPELAQLSSLDTLLGDVLSSRTRELFAKVPMFLGRRFGRLLDEHWQELSNKPAVGDIEQWMKPGGWIAKFCGEMRASLLAEIEVRLQPVLGMIDSLPTAAAFARTFDERKSRIYE